MQAAELPLAHERQEIGTRSREKKDLGGLVAEQRSVGGNKVLFAPSGYWPPLMCQWKLRSLHFYDSIGPVSLPKTELLFATGHMPAEAQVLPFLVPTRRKSCGTPQVHQYIKKCMLVGLVMLVMLVG